MRDRCAILMLSAMLCVVTQSTGLSANASLKLETELRLYGSFASPAMSYYFVSRNSDNMCGIGSSDGDDQIGHDHAQVTVNTEFHLEDGTYVGNSGGGGEVVQRNTHADGNVSAATQGAIAAAGWFTGQVAYNIGTWFSPIVRAAVSGYSYLTPLSNWGMAAAAAGPYAGAMIAVFAVAS